MMSFLKNHPFAVETHFESSTVLTFAILKEELQGFIPEYLEVRYVSRYMGSFIAVVMVEAKGLRPKGFPEFFGNNFFNWLSNICTIYE